MKQSRHSPFVVSTRRNKSEAERREKREERGLTLIISVSSHCACRMSPQPEGDIEIVLRSKY